MKIEIDKKQYKVVENLGFQAGYHAVIIMDEGKERTVVKQNRLWRWWTPQDRLGL